MLTGTINRKLFLFRSIFGLLAVFFLSSCGEKTYEDCLLEHSKDLQSKSALTAITYACSEKYSKKEKFDVATAKCVNRRELSSEELGALDGRGEITGNYFFGTIYNGNSALTVQEVTIGINYDTPKTSSGINNPFDKFSYRPFNLEVSILPNTAADISMKVLPKLNEYEKLNWNIISAKTCS
jgi:hypothetical protein